MELHGGLIILSMDSFPANPKEGLTIFKDDALWTYSNRDGVVGWKSATHSNSFGLAELSNHSFNNQSVNINVPWTSTHGEHICKVFISCVVHDSTLVVENPKGVYIRLNNDNTESNYSGAILSQEDSKIKASNYTSSVGMELIRFYSDGDEGFAESSMNISPGTRRQLISRYSGLSSGRKNRDISIMEFSSTWDNTLDEVTNINIFSNNTPITGHVTVYKMQDPSKNNISSI